MNHQEYLHYVVDKLATNTYIVTIGDYTGVWEVDFQYPQRYYLPPLWEYIELGRYSIPSRVNSHHPETFGPQTGVRILGKTAEEGFLPLQEHFQTIFVE